MKAQIAHTGKERAIVELFSSPKTVTVNLAAKAPNGTEPGRVLYNAQQGALVYAGTLPQLAADKSYELWVIPQTGNPIPAGVFSAQSKRRSQCCSAQYSCWSFRQSICSNHRARRRRYRADRPHGPSRRGAVNQ